MIAVALVALALLDVVPRVDVTGPRPIDPRCAYGSAAEIPRDAKGRIERSPGALATFRRANACPATGKTFGACDGWAIDHVVPLAVGGVDAPINMQWLPVQIKSAPGEYSKDRWERQVYSCFQTKR